MGRACMHCARKCAALMYKRIIVPARRYSDGKSLYALCEEVRL